jgi:nucleoside-diphosphate-sugar epimerase
LSRVLITGASGFLGSRMVKLLARDNHQVFALSRSGIRAGLADEGSKAVCCDLLNEKETAEALESIRPEVCFHFAWCSRPEQADAHDNQASLRASISLLKSLSDIQCRTIVAGSSAEYGTANGILSEETPGQEVNEYGRCKLALRDSAASLSGSFMHVRIFNVYGPGEDPNRVVPYLIRQMLGGSMCELTSGEQVRDYIHVDDLAAALWALARTDARGVVNVGSGERVRIKDVALKLAEILGGKHLLNFGAIPLRSTEPKVRCPDLSRLHSVTDWKPRFDLTSGLKATIEDWKQAAAARVGERL